MCWQTLTVVVSLTVCALVAGAGPAQQHPWPGPIDKDSPFRLEHDGTGVHVYEGDIPVFVYNYGSLLKEGVPADRRRSSYIHPVFDLNGKVITEDFPDDHHHHRGLFWTWPRVYVGEDEHYFDMWHLRGLWSRFDRWLALETRTHDTVIGLRNGWYTAEHKRVVCEDVWLRVHEADKHGRIIDIELELTALTDDVTLRGKAEAGYGGFCYRPAAAARDTILIATDTAPAITRGGTNFVPSTWADYSADFDGDGSPSGLCIIPAPSHPDYAPEWTTRYYGFLGVAWPGLGQYRIPKGETLSLHYRVYVHRGDWDTGNVKAAVESYQALYRD